MKLILAKSTPHSGTSARQRSYRTLLSIAMASLVVSGCGGDGDESSPPLLEDLQGRWISSTCEVVEGDDGAIFSEISGASEVSNVVEIFISGSTAIISSVQYVNSTSCEGSLTFSANSSWTITASGETTTVSTGEAKHLDFSADRLYITASDSLKALLKSLGTTLEDLLVGDQEEVVDLDNLDPDSTLSFDTIYQVSGDELRLGPIVASSPLEGVRATEFSSLVFIRQ
ncbi:MAG: hypothetical protein KTR25_07780 [Myxococcales bacterium]|nr:hypothetical protein [Myxococcales bacterium]